MDEKAFVVNAFNNNFNEFKNSNIVIYGLGKNTKSVIEECFDFNIVGLMDGTRTGETQWGLKILSEKELLDKDVKVIVIIATSANVPIIYKRIKKFSEQNGIDVFDINGEKLGKRKDKYEMPRTFSKIKQANLYEKIDAADIVSFDIFDTLLVRDVLFPTDVFELIEQENRSILPENYDYVSNRIKAERDLYMDTNPKLYEIYYHMYKKFGFPENLINIFMEKEICKEKEVLHARQEMIEVVMYVIANHKLICCTSDMYLSSDVLREILNNEGYNIENIIVSCEYGFAKCNGLFSVLRSRYPDKRILHIGDNYDADIKRAVSDGIDDTFEIVSGYQMLQKSAVGFIEDNANSLSDRKVLGEFVSKIMNNPFLFEETGGRGRIDSNYMLGYYFFEPMIQTFLSWLVKNVESEGIELLLLGSRDGWLIKNLLDIYQKEKGLNFQYKYFYASRFACTLAGMETKLDVKYAASLAFQGEMEDLFAKRFLLTQNEIQDRHLEENDEDYLERHIECILEHSQKYKKNYIEYAKQFEMSNKKVGFFDFVSSGTCQLWLEKIIGVQMKGYYFLRNYDEYKKHLTIQSMVTPKFAYEKQGKLYRDYIFLENILTSTEPTLKYIGNRGELVFDKEKRSKKTIADLMEIHNGIKDAYRNRMNIESVSYELAENLVDIIRPEYSVMHISYFNDNALLDEFCNRKFDLKQVLSTVE